MSYGGGAFLLTLSVIAGVLLITAAAKSTENKQNNNAGVVSAATEVVDGVTYNTVNLTGNHADNINKIKGTGGTNYKYVMTADWVVPSTHSGNINVFGQHIVFDFNGHSIDMTQVGFAFWFECNGNVTITDSSVAGTGRVLTNGSRGIYATHSTVKTLIIAGGNCDHAEMHCYGGNIVFKGGNYYNDNTSNGLVYRQNTSLQTITFAAYMVPTFNSGKLVSVTHSEDYQNDGITYQTIYLTGDDASNQSKINECNQNTNGNYRYVMTADWVSSGNKNIYGANVIWDLQGYTYTPSGYLSLYCTTFEIMDSSPAMTGTIVRGGVFLAALSDSRTKTVTISGGTMVGGKMHMYVGEVIFRGGNYQNTDPNDSQGVLWSATGKITVAPWVVPTWRNGVLTAIASCDYYAVSTSDTTAGIYNYAICYRWEITARDMAKLVVPTDKTYYLFGRSHAGAYQYLQQQYLNGVLTSVPTIDDAA